MDLYNINQAARMLGLSPSILRRYCRQGRLGQKVGKSWIISSSDLEQFVKEPRRVGYPKGRPRHSA